MLILVAALYHPGAAAAHGAASGEDDPCLRRVGESVVHFSAYQPQYELKDQYCTDIPKEGDTFLVVDLVDPALRNEPVGMRVVKGNGSNEAEDQIVADIRPSTHPDGVLRGEVRLDEGLYTVTISAEKQNLMRRPQYLLRVHMTDYQKLVRAVVVPAVRRAATGRGSCTSSYDRSGCGIGGQSPVLRKLASRRLQAHGSTFEREDPDNGLCNF